MARSPVNRVRVVVAKPGLDGHDRGAKVVAGMLRDAGMEVIYTGIFQTPENIVRTVLQEDAQVLGISILSGAHIPLMREIIKLLKEEGIRDNLLVLLGGTIPDQDVETLKEIGVDAVFGPGTHSQVIIDYINDWASKQAVS